jgi:hypothetical protein
MYYGECGCNDTFDDISGSCQPKIKRQYATETLSNCANRRDNTSRDNCVLDSNIKCRSNKSEMCVPLVGVTITITSQPTL